MAQADLHADAVLAAEADRALEVTLLMRAPQERSYSIEAVFGAVAEHLPSDMRAEVVTSPYPSRGIWKRLRAALHAWRAARGADVVHVTGDTHFMACFAPRRRTILTIHDCTFLERATGLRRAVLWFFWIRLPIWRAAVVTVVSEASKAQLARWVRLDPARVVVIENPLPRAMSPADKAFTERPRLLMLGTGPHKNIERVAEALSGLPVELEVIGRLSTERLARLGAHVSVSSRHDLPDDALAEAYARSDILMFPSLVEGFGLPILEAQAVGRPVVTSDRAPMRDVAGDGALLVDPEDPAALRGAVMRLMAEPDLRARLVAAGFANLQRFRPERIAARYAQLYRDVWEATR